MNKIRIKKYAKLIARVGANVRRGQEVIISAGLDQPEFIKMLVDECYRAGAKKVSVDWSYLPLTASSVKYCSEDVLGSLDAWQLEKWEHQAKVLPCKIYILSDDPDGLNGIDQGKYSRAMASRSRLIKPIRDKMENKYQWCIAAVPGKEWAKKVFPADRVNVAVEKLWKAILEASRVTDDPIKAWREHNENLAKKCEHLNSLGIKKLHYTAKNGTDFTVGLNPEAQFMAGGEHAEGSGIYFNPNIPTEEIFTSPMRGDAKGVVYSSRPLSYGGQLIDNFWLRFEDGKVVDFGAEKNEEMLRELLGMDEGASYLGEIALVPYSSPIRKSEILFYNTLFDENAACHLALGRGFTNTLRDYEKYTEEEAHKMGINDSIIHEDFMIGTADLSIIGILEDSTEVAIFENGEFAF